MNTITTRIPYFIITITFSLFITLLGTNSVFAYVTESEPDLPTEDVVEIDFYEIPVVTREQTQYVIDTYGMSSLHHGCYG